MQEKAECLILFGILNVDSKAMRRSAIGCFLLFLTFSNGFGAVVVDKKSVYQALSSGEEKTIDKMISQLESEKSSAQNSAYIGALTMKKAGFLKGVKTKVNTFKKGAQLLENEIKQNPDKVEFRFLRLTVQEHAPNVLKYNKQIDEDKRAVLAGYAKLDEGLKAIIADYAKDSKVLKAADLK
jgi:ribosomal protein L16 Arg81 hydroxylase